MQINDFIIPEPVKYNSVEVIYDEDIVSYMDCFEISLLRFLHLIFGKNNKIDLELLQIDMDNSKYCSDLVDFFTLRNYFSNDEYYYFTEIGLVERSDWCKFLNDSRLFKYKQEDGYEVCATIENLFTFFRIYFPKNNFDSEDILDITIDNIESNKLFEYYENKLNKLFKNISYTFDLSCKLNYLFKKSNTDEIESIYTNIILEIYLNNTHLLDWEIYQFHNLINGKITERITGHSDYRLINDKKLL
jgi:hypothetical protein